MTSPNKAWFSCFTDLILKNCSFSVVKPYRWFWAFIGAAVDLKTRRKGVCGSIDRAPAEREPLVDGAAATFRRLLDSCPA